MEKIEFNVTVNGEVRIPEWLRRKMGLTDDQETISDGDKDEREDQALEAELVRLANAIRRCRYAHAYSNICIDDNRDPDRC